MYIDSKKYFCTKILILQWHNFSVKNITYKEVKFWFLSFCHKNYLLWNKNTLNWSFKSFFKILEKEVSQFFDGIMAEGIIGHFWIIFGFQKISKIKVGKLREKQMVLNFNQIKKKWKKLMNFEWIIVIEQPGLRRRIFSTDCDSGLSKLIFFTLYNLSSLVSFAFLKRYKLQKICWAL